MKDGKVWANLTTIGKQQERELSAVEFLPSPDDWRLKGACVGMDTEDFIAGPVEHYPVIEQAREACLWCPVFKECSQSFEGEDHKYVLKAGRIPDEQAAPRGLPAKAEPRGTKEPKAKEPKVEVVSLRKSHAKREPVTHCKNGHEFTPENTRICTPRNGAPYRHCRACHRMRVAKSRAGAKMAA